MTEPPAADARPQLPSGYERLEVTGGTGVLDVVTYGPTDAPALLYQSGTPSGPWALEPLAEAAVTAGLRYVNYGRPGYGRSTPHAGRSVADAVPDGLAVLDALGHGEFVTVGWSGGGPHALASAALADGRCLAAAIVAGVAPHDGAGLDWTAGMGDENLAEFDLAEQGRPALDEFLQVMGSAVSTATQDQIAAALGDLVNEADRAAIAGVIGRYLVHSMAIAVEVGVDGWGDDDIAFVNPWEVPLEAIRCPVYIFQGDGDRMVPLGHGRWLADHVAGASYEEFPGEGHISLWDRILPGMLEPLAAAFG